MPFKTVPCPICSAEQVVCGILGHDGSFVFERECGNCGVIFHDEGPVEEMGRVGDVERWHPVCADLQG